MLSPFFEFINPSPVDNIRQILGVSGVAPHRLYHSNTFTYAAVLDAMMFNACRENKLIFKTEDGLWLPTHKAKLSGNKPLTFRCGIAQISGHVKAHWKGANFDEKSVRDVVKNLESLGLFTIVDENPALRRPKQYTGFVMNEVVKAYEAVWQVFTEQQKIAEGMQGKKRIKLPEHGGSFGKRMMGLLFRRKLDTGFAKKSDEAEVEVKTKRDRRDELKAAEMAVVSKIMECDRAIKQQMKLAQNCVTKKIIEAETEIKEKLKLSLRAIQAHLTFEFEEGDQYDWYREKSERNRNSTSKPAPVPRFAVA